MSATSQNLSSKQILDAVKDLPNKEFEKFFNKVLIIRANSQAKKPRSNEAEILKKIYRVFGVTIIESSALLECAHS